MSRINVDKITGKTGTNSGAPITLSGDTATLGSGVTGRVFSNVDRWRLTANDDCNADPLEPWARTYGTVTLDNHDANRIGVNIGTAMSYSSGIFTFPTTGYWWIRAHFELQGQSLTSRYVNTNIMGTDDNGSNWTGLALARSAFQNSSIGYVNVSTDCDVFYVITDVSNQKIKTSVNAENTSVDIRTGGSTSGQDETTLTFIKMGDV